MKNTTFKTLLALLLISFGSCSQNNKKINETVTEYKIETKTKTVPHRYGGWYCPDNLKGFPPVDITNWKDVPVINGRMATKEETQTEASLIFVNTETYPNAKALNIKMPKLARFYNDNTHRKELIIVIQAFSIDNDSIIGFRYLNGGNGSARIHEAEFISDKEIESLKPSKFVSLNIEILAPEEVVWDVITNEKYSQELRPYFDKNNTIDENWRKKSNLNFNYSNSGKITSAFADKHFGSFYIQNDYNRNLYNEKLFLFMNNETGVCNLQIVFGPFLEDFETQNTIIQQWSNAVKLKSEKTKSFKIPTFEK